MASLLYRNMGLSLSLDDVNTIATANNLYGMLMQTSYTPDQDHEHVSDLVPGTNEVSVAGYTAGGQELSVATAPNYDAANNRNEMELTDETYTGLAAGETVAGCAIHDRTNGTDATRDLIAYVEFAVAVPTTGGDITVNFDAETLRFNL